MLRASAASSSRARARSCSTARPHDHAHQGRGRTLGMLPQAPVAPEGLTVADLVARGRHPHQVVDPAVVVRRRDRGRARAGPHRSRPRGPSRRPASGGQRQRAWISMALAQAPTSCCSTSHHLPRSVALGGGTRPGRPDARGDGPHRDHVLHDLNPRRPLQRSSDRHVRGRIVASGKPQDVISAELLADVFGLEATVIDDPVSDRPLIVPIGTRHVYGAGAARTANGESRQGVTIAKSGSGASR